MFGSKKRKNLHNNAVGTSRAKEIEEAENEHREANQAYIKADYDGAPAGEVRKAEQRVQQALKRLDALTGTYRPRKNGR